MYQGNIYSGRFGAAFYAMSGVDMALWDIRSKALGVCSLMRDWFGMQRPHALIMPWNCAERNSSMASSARHKLAVGPELSRRAASCGDEFFGIGFFSLHGVMVQTS